MAQTKSPSIHTKQDRRLVVATAPPASRMLPAMPFEIVHSPFLRVEMSYERLNEDVIYRFRGAGLVGDDAPNINAYITRETFFDVKTPGEVLDFLSVTGYFRTQDEAFPTRHETLCWSDFQRWQELIRILIQNGPLPDRRIIQDGKDVGTEFGVPERLRPIMGELSVTEMLWLHGYPDGIVITSEPESPKPGSRQLVARINVHSTLEAILATAYLDRLNGVNFGLCQLADCNRLFEITSNHAREYCSQECAHKASVRRRRAAVKAAKAKANPGTANRSTKKGRE